LYFDANDSHYFKSVTSSVELANENVFASVANVEIVVIMGYAPAFTDHLWQGNLCFKLRIQGRIEVFKDNKHVALPG
jgi:hypothetical protein